MARCVFQPNGAHQPKIIDDGAVWVTAFSFWLPIPDIYMHELIGAHIVFLAWVSRYFYYGHSAVSSAISHTSHQQHPIKQNRNASLSLSLVLMKIHFRCYFCVKSNLTFFLPQHFWLFCFVFVATQANTIDLVSDFLFWPSTRCRFPMLASHCFPDQMGKYSLFN